MSRQCKDWLQSFVEFGGYGEAHPSMLYWIGASTISGALGRRVWFDQVSFQWFPNIFLVFVAEAGVIAKTTTTDIGMSLLKALPEGKVHIGPGSTNWAALADKLKDYKRESINPETGEVLEEWAFTIHSGELGNLIKPKEPDMLDFMIDLYDGRKIDKITKGNGCDLIEAPILTLVGCTTPSWMASSFSEHTIAGGFASRCLFYFAKEKYRVVSYLEDNITTDHYEKKRLLAEDLAHINEKLVGQYVLTKEAKEWGNEWNIEHNKGLKDSLLDKRFTGYKARKQAHMHKLAMIIAASRRDQLIITKADLQEAEQRLSSLEVNMPFAYSLIGKEAGAANAEKFISFIHRAGTTNLETAYRYMHGQYPTEQEFLAMATGAARAGFIKMRQTGMDIVFTKGEALPEPVNLPELIVEREGE
jgi:hypothetical protein